MAMAAITNSTGSDPFTLAFDIPTVNFPPFVEKYWEIMVTNYSPLMITMVFTFIVHELSLIVAYIPWLICDMIPFFARYKIQPKKHNDWKQFFNCLKWVAVNQFCMQLPIMYLFHMIVDGMGFRMDLPLPSVNTVAWQIVVFFFIEDFIFYWVHRFLHWKPIYPYIHKIHHEHTAPFGLAAEYAHPAETLLLGVATITGPIIFARHLLTVWIWLILRLFETIEDHSGYIVPWNPTRLIPFWGGARHHDWHHKNFVGNYASIFTIWDYVLGTDTEYRRELKAKKE